jgi:hypothetical protein
MSINIIQENNKQNINVTIDDYCNHFAAEEEYIEYPKLRFDNDSYSYIPDDSEELLTLVCSCGYEEVLE